MARVSVIIPAFNADPLIRRAIDSVLAQTHDDVELIVVDDGSRDGTVDAVRSYGDRVVLHRQKNAGVSAARNAGAARASGQWLAFLDHDDTWAPEKLERQLARADAPLVYTDRYNAGVLGDYPRRQSDRRIMLEGDIFEALLLHGNFITVSSVMLRRDVFDEAGGFYTDVHGGEDWDLWLRVAARYPIALVREPLVTYRLDPASMSGNHRVMAANRRCIVARALALPRGRQLAWSTRRRVWAETFRTNGWDAARRGATLPALLHYARAAAAWPLELQTIRRAAGVLLRSPSPANGRANSHTA